MEKDINNGFGNVFAASASAFCAIKANMLFCRLGLSFGLANAMRSIVSVCGLCLLNVGAPPMP